MIPSMRYAKGVRPLCAYFVPMQEMEIEVKYRGSDIEADKKLFMQEMLAIEARHLPYFINRPGIFEDDAYERLKDHFFIVFVVVVSSRVILLHAESSLLPPEIADEVQAAFRYLFETKE